MAIDAFDGVDIVGTVLRVERGIHSFYLQPAVGELRVAGGARFPSFLAMSLMTAKAADPLVDAQGRMIVARTCLRAGHRRVALIAEGLARVRADFYLPIRFAHGWQG